MYEGLKNLEVPRAAKTRGPRRVARALLFGLLAFAVLVAGLGIYTYINVRGDLIGGIDHELRNLKEALPGEPLNILVLGSDSREGVTRKDRRQGLGGPGGQRADVIMLLHIYEGGNKAALVSIPRDLRVEIPGHGVNKINAAYAFGGRNLMIRTVRRLTGIKPNHFIDVNFFGFRGIVEAIKGVPVVVDREIHDDKAKLDIPGAGCWVLDGNEALAWVRARQFDPTADIGRISRQQQFLRSMAKRVGSIGTLANPAAVGRISENVGRYFRYDAGLVAGTTFDRARAIAAALATLDQRKLDFRIVPSYSASIGGISYLIPYEDQMDAMWHALRNDRNLPDFGRTSESVPERGDVLVQVLNATKRQGLAGKQSARLANRGFNTLDPGNADRRRARTLILYESDDELKADLVKRFYKGAKLRRVTFDMTADVQVIIGRDFLRRGEDDEPDPAPDPDPFQNCKPLP